MRDHRPTRHRHESPTRAYRTAARTVTSVLAVSALVVTGIGWWGIGNASSSITTSDALPSDAPTTDSTGAMNILLMGLDTRKDQDGNDLPPAILDQLHAGDGEEGGYNTNTLILLHVPAGGGNVTAFSIPRDDYVAVSGIPGNDHVKIKEAYGLKMAATQQQLVDDGVTDPHVLETEGREAGRKETLQTVSDFTGVPIDHFAEVTLAGFYDLATALGGVQVCLNQPVDDSAYSGAVFPAGVQTLNGSQALAFVRQRHGLANGDLDRTHRQQAFLVSVMHSLESAGTFTDVSKLSALLDVIRKDVVVSSGWDLESIASQANSLGGATVGFSTLPIVRYDTVDGQDVNIVDRSVVRHTVLTAFGLPDTAPPPTSTVDVINADGRPGLGGQTMSTLTARGFKAGTVGNGSSSYTTVQYGQGADEDATTVAATLGDVTAEPDDAVQAGHIKVTLGRGYRPADGPTEGASTGGTQAIPSPAPTVANQDNGSPVSSSSPVPCVD
ncbi:LCP family protein [Actinomycetes bacterium M1A6_2h]